MLLSHHTPPVVALIIIGVAVWAIYAAFGWLMTRGGTASEEAGQIIYSLRPGMRILSYASLLFGLWLLWCAVSPRQETEMRLIELFFGIVCAGGGAFILSTKMILDEAGIHYVRWPNKRTTIAWESLDHYEVVVNTRQVTSTFYYLRPKDGESIVVTDNAYNAEDLMTRIKARHPLPQQPYKRRKWYGG
jgi:hypothetical protein